MTFYTLKDSPGCVITEIRAVQYQGDPDVIRETFGNDVQYWPDVIEQYAPVMIVKDRHGERRMLMFSDFLFEHPEDSGHLLVLSARNFLDTYKQVDA